jgi:hypothetical protein
MEINISKTWVSAKCPKCTYGFEIQTFDIINESLVYCNNCKCKIEILDEEASGARAKKNIENAIKELNNTLKNLFK